MRTQSINKRTPIIWHFEYLGDAQYIHCGEELLMTLGQLHGIKFMLY
jgi:hypothetical protein